MNISIFAANFCIKVKKFFVVLCCLIVGNSVFGQINEIGIFAGGSNFVGDVGKENYIDPNSVALGLVYKWNKSTRHAWRFSVMHSTLQIDDANAESLARQQRNYALENKITEISAGLEFNFFEFNLHDLGFKITPYVHTGLNYFWYDSMYFASGVAEKDGEKARSFSIPMTLGIKFNLSQSWILGLESSVRYTFADDIDGSHPKNDRYENLSFGNLNSNDWYVFTGFTLTYTFGRNPCYCPL